jgi:hypothetical protein
MSPVPADQRLSYLARQVGSLALSRVSLANPMALTRAASWHNHLHRLGVSLPLVVVHDLGLLLTAGGSEEGGGSEPRRGAGSEQAAVFGARPLQLELPEEAGQVLGAYGELLQQLAQSEVMQTAASWRIRDELVAVILYKLLRDLQMRWPARRAWVGAQELPLDPGVYLNLDLVGHFRQFDAGPVLSLLGFLAEHRLHLITSLEQIDLDTLRLLGLFRSGEQLGGVVDLADLLQVFSSPEANDVVNFSMDLIPSVLETKRASGVQVFSVDGYAGIERQGSIDSVVLSEFAFDRDIFEQKIVDNELYYYGHEKHRADERRLQYVLVDSSASMRGVRQVFARGLALTLVKKLSLRGDEVWLRFFDSRLYEVIRVEERREASVPYLLCFRSERGRNYGRVFRQLAGELERFRRHDSRPVVVYLITHGQCHVSTDLIERLRQLAELYGVFILPSSTLHLDYLPLLQRYQIVGADSLSSRQRSVDRALEIVDDAAAAPERRAGRGGAA